MSAKTTCESIAKSIAGSAVGGTVQSVGEDVGGAVESIGDSIGSLFGGGSSWSSTQGLVIRPMKGTNDKAGVSIIGAVSSGTKTRVEGLFEIFTIQLIKGGFSVGWGPTPYRILGVIPNYPCPDDYMYGVKPSNQYDNEAIEILKKYHDGGISRLQALYNTFQLEVDKKLSPGFLQYCCYRPLGVIFDRDWSMPA